MDPLTYLLMHFSLRAGVFYTGPLCGVHDFDHDASRGHLHLFYRGRVTITGTGMPALEVREPTLVFMPRPDSHRLDIADGEEVQVLCGTVQFGGGGSNPISDSLPPVLMAKLAELPRVELITELLFAEAVDILDGRQAVLDRLCEILVIKLLRHSLAHGLVHGGALAGLSDARLAKALIQMHELPGQPWSIVDMAEQAGMSRARFSARFNEVVGESPADYLAGWRVMTAQRLLRQGMQMKQVSVEVGYGSSSAFTRAFVRKSGCTPSEWLRRQQLV